MAKLIHKNKAILPQMKYANNIFTISRGLMFSSKRRVERGMCLVMPNKRDARVGATVTMMFCFYSMDILFVNSRFEVADKVCLKPFRLSYVPKGECCYVIESLPGTFKGIKIGDKVEINR